MSPPTSRRTVLRLGGSLLVAALAGCASRRARPDRDETTAAPSPDETASTPPISETPSSTATETVRCDDAITHAATPEPQPGFDPKPYPERPDPLTESAAGRFATAYEEAFVWNDVLRTRSELTYLDLGVHRPSVEPTENGFLVTFDVSLGYGTREDATTGTPFVLHADDWWTARYYVDDRVIRRAIDRGDDPPDPRTWRGAILECSP